MRDRFQKAYEDNSSELNTNSYALFFLTITDTITSYNTDLSSRITLYFLEKTRGNSRYIFLGIAVLLVDILNTVFWNCNEACCAIYR